MKNKKIIYSEETAITVIDKEPEDKELEIAKLAEIWKTERKKEKTLLWYKKMFG